MCSSYMNDLAEYDTKILGNGTRNLKIYEIPPPPYNKSMTIVTSKHRVSSLGVIIHI